MKCLSINLALGISCERRFLGPAIVKSLYVSSLITAKLLLRRKLQTSLSRLLRWILLCSFMISRLCPWAVTIQKTNYENSFVFMCFYDNIRMNYWDGVLSEKYYLWDWRYICLRNHVESLYSYYSLNSLCWYHLARQNRDTETHQLQVDDH